MRNKIVDAAEAVAIIRSGDTVASSGFVGVGTPDEIIKALERRFIQTGEPRDLSLVFAAAPGDGADRGLNRLAHPGLLKRLVGGHFGLVPKLARMAVDNQVEAYNLPLGCVSHLFREIAGRKAGLLSKVGLGTFVDPANGGGKLNQRTVEELVRVMEIDGENWLFYKAFPINVAIIRGTTADRNGNISMEKEALTLDALALRHHHAVDQHAGDFHMARIERTGGGHAFDLGDDKPLAVLGGGRERKRVQGQRLLFHRYVAVAVGGGAANDRDVDRKRLVEKPVLAVDLHDADEFFGGALVQFPAAIGRIDKGAQAYLREQAGLAPGNLAKQMRDAAQRQVVGLDLIVDRHSRQLRHQSEMSTDQALDQARMRQPIEAAIGAVAGRRGKHQREIAGLACLDKALLQRPDDFIRRADTDKA